MLIKIAYLGHGKLKLMSVRQADPHDLMSASEFQFTSSINHRKFQFTAYIIIGNFNLPAVYIIGNFNLPLSIS